MDTHLVRQWSYKSFFIQCRFKVDVFLWNWQNASGKAETNIILVRFFMVASYGLRAASKSGGFDLDAEYSGENQNDKSAKTQSSKSLGESPEDSETAVYDA